MSLITIFDAVHHQGGPEGGGGGLCSQFMEKNKTRITVHEENNTYFTFHDE